MSEPVIPAANSRVKKTARRVSKAVSLVPIAKSSVKTVEYGNRRKNVKRASSANSQSCKSGEIRPVRNSTFSDLPPLTVLPEAIEQGLTIRDGGAADESLGDILTVQFPNSPRFEVTFPQIMSPTTSSTVQFAGFNQYGPNFQYLSPFSDIINPSSPIIIGKYFVILATLGWNPSNPNWFPSGMPPPRYIYDSDDSSPAPSLDITMDEDRPIMTVAVDTAESGELGGRDVNLDSTLDVLGEYFSHALFLFRMYNFG